MFKTVISSSRYQLEVGKQSSRRLAENTHNSQSSDLKKFVTDRYTSNANQRCSKNEIECDLTFLLEVSELDFAFKEFSFESDPNLSFGAQKDPATSDELTHTQSNDRCR